MLLLEVTTSPGQVNDTTQQRALALAGVIAVLIYVNCSGGKLGQA